MRIPDSKSTSREASSMRLVGSRFLLFLMTLALTSAGIRIYAQSEGGKPSTQPGYGALSYSTGFDGGGLLRQLDKDRDGYITHKEWERFFIDHHLNSDERLSPEEIQPISQQKGGEE